jgi:hypothetical protein
VKFHASPIESTLANEIESKARKTVADSQVRALPCEMEINFRSSQGTSGVVAVAFRKTLQLG